ncbi:ATP-binding cassette domain-containing protein [soil metagenome]
MVLELDQLSKRYGATTALDSLSFEVEPGQVFGFVGPNGAGKTTAMRIVLGVLAADSGEVRWHGKPLDPEARRRIGYMPEERGLYPKMQVAEQLSYLAELHGVERKEATAAAKRWTERLGVAERASDKVEELSLGNQQRVQLGAALVHSPDLLVLDEPFSGLDPVGVDVLSQVLLDEARSRGVPVVFSSHQLELIERLCDAVAIIKDGKLVASGTVDSLRTEWAGNRWRVVAGDQDDAWAERLEGVTALGDHVFDVAEGTNPQGLLVAACARGEVTHFGRDVPDMAELFRDVVAGDDQVEDAA